MGEQKDAKGEEKDAKGEEKARHKAKKLKKLSDHAAADTGGDALTNRCVVAFCRVCIPSASARAYTYKKQKERWIEKMFADSLSFAST